MCVYESSSCEVIAAGTKTQWFTNELTLFNVRCGTGTVLWNMSSRATITPYAHVVSVWWALRSAAPHQRPEAMNRELRGLLGTRHDLFSERVPPCPDVEHLVAELDASTVALINRLYGCSSLRPLWVMRHAQSCSNLVAKWDHGRHSHSARTAFKHRWFNDPALSDAGRVEAVRRGEFWIDDGLPPCSTIYTSFMRRGILTAQFMAESLPIVRIVPIPFCSEFGSNVPDSPAEIMKSLTLEQQKRMDWQFQSVPDGHVPDVHRFLKWFDALTFTEPFVLICHGGFMRRFYSIEGGDHVFANTAVTSTVLNVGANAPTHYTLLADGFRSPPVRCDRCVPHRALRQFIQS